MRDTLILPAEGLSPSAHPVPVGLSEGLFHFAFAMYE
jgi:hypothetical protein